MKEICAGALEAASSSDTAHYHPLNQEVRRFEVRARARPPAPPTGLALAAAKNGNARGLIPLTSRRHPATYLTGRAPGSGTRIVERRDGLRVWVDATLDPREGAAPQACNGGESTRCVYDEFKVGAAL